MRDLSGRDMSNGDGLRGYDQEYEFALFGKGAGEDGSA